MNSNKMEMEHSINSNASKEEEHVLDTITTESGLVYREEMLLNRFDQIKLLDDYIGGSEISTLSTRWVESFSREDLLQIFTTFPLVHERCNAQMTKTIGPAIRGVLLFNDTFCNLFENVLQKAKKIHLVHGWGFGEDTDEFNDFELAISLLHTFLSEDLHASKPNELNLTSALDQFAESNFVQLDNIRFEPISTQLVNISQHGRCSSGFSEQLSRIYTALMLARAMVFYENVLEKKSSADNQEHSNNPYLWDYHQAAVFFKMKPELKKEMESPLYHGNIDTQAAKRLLRNPGEYLARYSSNYKNYYITILFDAKTIYDKSVLNLIIPLDKVEPWIKNPIESREEIECFIKMHLSIQRNESTKLLINKFFENEQYAPVFNPVCNPEIVNASHRTG
jgi:hypothetical protein